MWLALLLSSSNEGDNINTSLTLQCRWLWLQQLMQDNFTWAKGGHPNAKHKPLQP
jgi:hypothetical protein